MVGTLGAGAIQLQTALTGVLQSLHSAPAMMLSLLAVISWDPLLPYFTGAFILILGVSTVIKKEISSAHGVDKLLSFGPLFIAVPMAVFGADHFVFAGSITQLVPSWIPWHPFWVYFVGACLIGGALSLSVRKYAALSAGLFGIMLLLFEVLIHFPKVASAPGDRFAWAVALRELVFAWSALSFAVTQAVERGTHGARTVITLGRFFIGLPIIFFGVEHFLHPEFKPAVPLNGLTPLWIPARLYWGYLTGAVLAVTGLCLIANKKGQAAATWLGVFLFLLVVGIYVPITIARPSAIGDGLNYLADTLLLSGSALCFARAQREKAADATLSASKMDNLRESDSSRPATAPTINISRT